MVSLALNIIPDGPIEEVIDLVQVAENTGYSTCRLYDEGLATHDVYVISAAVALATSSMLVGPGITNPFTRHPGQTAAAHASLAELSGGRAVAGFGAGGSLTLDALGLSRCAGCLTARTHQRMQGCGLVSRSTSRQTVHRLLRPGRHIETPRSGSPGVGLGCCHSEES